MRVTDRYNEYLSALLDGNRPACHTIAADLLQAEISVRALYDTLNQARALAGLREAASTVADPSHG